MSMLAARVRAAVANASWIRKMFEEGNVLKARHGADNVCDFSLGNPDLPAPKAVVDGLRTFSAVADRPFAFGYMPNAGFPWAREALAGHLSKEQEIAVGADDVLLSCGAAGALNAFLRTVMNPGEQVCSFAPYFVEYGFYAENHGGTFQAVSSRPDTFAPDVDGLAAMLTPAVKVVLVNSPNNPTGVVYSREDMQALADMLEAKGREFGHPIWLLSDEPYRFLTYDGVKVPPVLPLSPHAVCIGSFSKNLSLPGERIGYAAISPLLEGREELMAGLTLSNRILGYVNPPVVGQHLMVAGMESGVDVAVYDSRRKAMAKVLSDAGYSFIMPKGAFYFFPVAPGGDDVAFAARLVEERILAVPGSGFGWPGHFRLAFCVPEETILKSAEGFARAHEAAKK